MGPENSTPSPERASGNASATSTPSAAPLQHPATPWRGALIGIAVALGCVAGAVVLERLFDPWLGLRFPFFALFLASAAAAWVRGPWIGALTAILSYLIARFAFGASHLEPFVLPPVETAAYALFSALVIALASAARAAHAELRERQTRLAHEIAERMRVETQHGEAVEREQAARREAEASQRQLEERVEELETLMDLIPIGIYVAHDRECRRITGNRAAGALLSTDPRGNLSRSAPPGEQQVRPHRVLQNGRELSLDELPLQRAAREGTESVGQESSWRSTTAA